MLSYFHHIVCCQRLKLLLIFLCLSLFFPLPEKIEAQSFPFREYSVADGLPQSYAANLVQDSRGYLWIITRNGLSRFDGIDFVNYFRKSGLPVNNVYDIVEDSAGIIWAFSKAGMSRYTGDGFVTYPAPDSLRSYLSLESIIPGEDNSFYTLWAGPGITKKNIIKFRNGKYINYGKLYPPIDTLQIIHISYDPESKKILLGDKDNFLWIWDEARGELQKSRKFQTLFNDGKSFRAYSNDTIFKFNKGKIEVFDYRDAGRTSVLYYMWQINREVSLFKDNTLYKIGLPFSYTGYLLDKEDVLWLNSEAGLFRLLSTAFNSFSEKEIGTTNVWAISEDRNGHVWFGSLYNTLIEYDGKSFRERNDWKHLYKGIISFFKGSRVMSNGDMWISTSDGVLIWNGSRFSVLDGLPENTQIVFIYEDPENGIVMLGTQIGLYVIKDGKKDLFPRFKDSDLGVIEGVIKDDDGSYWLSGHRGVLKFDGINAVPVRESILPQLFTYTLIKDSRGGIWITSEEGLFVREKGSSSFVHGLPEPINRMANSIIVVDSTHILVGRSLDICMIDLVKFYAREKNYFRTYDRNDGFEGKDCLDNGIIKDRTGRFWILTSSNAVIFDPRKLTINTHPPLIRLTGFSYQSDSLTWEPIDKTNFYYGIPDKIRLNRNQNKVQLTFSGISLSNPENVKMQYRLAGYDDNWSMPSAKRSVVYENLPPGEYSFEVRGTNADGIATPEPFRMSFRVVPAFWQTKLFLVFSALLVIALSVVITLKIMKRRLLKLKEEERLRSELSRLQMSSVLKQFDPHFSFNVISSVGSLIMKGEKEIAYDYIIKLSALLRTLLSNESMIFRSLSDEIDFVRGYCELQKLRFRDRFDFKIVIDENVDLQREIPKMIIQTFVENSIKHGFENRIEGGRIEIDINKTVNATEISIIDNGIGRDAAHRNISKGTGQGLKIIGGIFDLMNEYNYSKSTVEIKDLWINNVCSGTSVKIIIPDDYRFEFGNGEI